MTSSEQISERLREAQLDGWLIYDYRGSNPVFSHFLGGGHLSFTRRAFLLFTSSNEPRLLISRVDATDAVRHAAGEIAVDLYTTWRDLQAWLSDHLKGMTAVAMEYSPKGELPSMSRVDGGTLDLVRRSGVEVHSSASLFQACAAAWSDENLASHLRAMGHVVQIKDAAFEFVADRLRRGESCSEDETQAFILSEFERCDLVTDEPPIVAVNAHSGDPHYEPAPGQGAVIEPGDWLLIDLWAKERGADAIFADITWVAYLGTSVPQQHRDVFEAVARGRDAAVERLRTDQAVAGFELDRVTRTVIEDAGWGDYFVHRTGHSLSPGESVHGLGTNLDDLETHDTRTLTVGTGFTIEPGIYLPEFGVRLEINAYIAPGGVEVTSPVQEAPLTFDI
jgi:Xaa-Pro aminopeptidase